MNWGKWIVVSFVLFAAFIATLVTVCLKEDVSLVSNNYYAEEIAYQDQIERMNNTSRLSEKPDISINDQYLIVEYKDLNRIDKGTLHLFCPANARLDQNFNLSATNEEQIFFPVGEIPPGMYRVRMRWTMNDDEYYTEEVIQL